MCVYGGPAALRGSSSCLGGAVHSHRHDWPRHALIDEQQSVTIPGEDGVDNIFESRSLLGVTFDTLIIGAPVTFAPATDTKQATAVQLADP